MQYLLVDNGSLRASSVLNLRRVAAELSQQSGESVHPASLLHSSKVPEEELNGMRARTWEQTMKALIATGERSFCVIPFFFGPTGAIMDYMPKRIAALKEKYGDFHIERTPFLYPGESESCDDLLGILKSRILDCIGTAYSTDRQIILVDHGSPLKEVAAIRDVLAERLGRELAKDGHSVCPASMESRDGEAYNFNLPLLKDCLSVIPQSKAPVIVSMLFLSPGRHAGDGGDVAQICSEAEERRSGLKIVRTQLVGTHPDIVGLLHARLSMPRSSLRGVS